MGGQLRACAVLLPSFAWLQVEFDGLEKLRWAFKSKAEIEPIPSESTDAPASTAAISAGQPLVLSGAGSAGANGIYAVDSDFNGRPMWTCAETGIPVSTCTFHVIGGHISSCPSSFGSARLAAAPCAQIWHNEGQWRIGNTNDYWYLSTSDAMLPPTSSGAWELGDHTGVVGPGPALGAA